MRLWAETVSAILFPLRNALATSVRGAHPSKTAKGEAADVEAQEQAIHIFSALRRITSKDKVGSFGLFVAGETAFHKRSVAMFAVCEVTEPPAAGRGVFG